MRKTLILFLLLPFIGILLGCTKNLPKEYILYRSDFENGRGDLQVFNINGLDKSNLSLFFNNTYVLGPLNHKAVYRNFVDLPKHSLLKITLDLYLHDQWVGSKQPNPDLWALF